MRPYLPSPIAARSWPLATISAPSSSPTRRSTHQRLRSLPRAPRPVLPPTVFGPCSPAKFGSCSDRPVVSALMLDEIGAALDLVVPARRHDRHRDRKSTRLNSSHLGISYAVFCLKKKKTKNNTTYK